MKGWLLVFVVVLLVSCDNSDKNNTDDEVVTSVTVDYEVYPFPELIDRADVIAEVQVGRVVKEIDTGTPSTILEGEILDVLKGEPTRRTIQFKQETQEEIQVNGQSVYNRDDVYVFFFKEASREPYDYWIISLDSGAFFATDGVYEQGSYTYTDLEDLEPSGQSVVERDVLKSTIADQVSSKDDEE
ncbi:hypothetical protein ACE1TF_06960 [Geomicrobium sp. JSM 1781026]|uniref:hypothetical protein n=1 Tax=Geomicrobium sp. JSM 1781026 TaxID=3344580 RepID=UPI0035C110E3